MLSDRTRLTGHCTSDIVLPDASLAARVCGLHARRLVGAILLTVACSPPPLRSPVPPVRAEPPVRDSVEAPPTRTRLTPRVENALGFTGRVLVVTREETPFPYQTSATARADSSEEGLLLQVTLRPDTNVLSILARVDSAPLQPFGSIDSLGSLTSAAIVDTLACQSRIPRASALIIAILFPPRDRISGELASGTITSRHQTCLASTLLAGEVAIEWTAPAIARDSLMTMQGTLRGILRSDSTKALPLHIQATLRGSVTLTIVQRVLMPMTIGSSIQVDYEATNARIQQRLHQTARYELSRVPPG
jgi:hypothetical protein